MSSVATAVPEDRDGAEAYLLAELGRLADELEGVEANRLSLYERRRELYVLGRSLDPPVPGSRMAQAARVSDAALVLSGRRKGKKKP